MCGAGGGVGGAKYPLGEAPKKCFKKFRKNI